MALIVDPGAIREPDVPEVLADRSPATPVDFLALMKKANVPIYCQPSSSTKKVRLTYFQLQRSTQHLFRRPVAP